MIAQIIAGMRKGMSDKELREWLNHKAEEAERRGNYGAADMRPRCKSRPKNFATRLLFVLTD